MHWSYRFVGLPFASLGRGRDGLDCYGLLRLVLAEEHGIRLPTYTERYVSVEERAEVAAVLAGESGRGPWCSVAPGQEAPFDALVFAVLGAPMHVGIVVRPGLMLHVSRGHESRIEAYRGGAWAPRLLSIHRHEGLCPSS